MEKEQIHIGTRCLLLVIMLVLSYPAQAQGLFDACAVDGNCVFAPAEALGNQPTCDSIFDTNGNRSFYVPWQGGHCRSCPVVDGVQSVPTVAGGCELPGGEDLQATNGRKSATGMFKTDCPKGRKQGTWFLHGVTGVCYRCPQGYNRTANAIDGGAACSKAIAARKVESQFVRSLSCDTYYKDELADLKTAGTIKSSATTKEAGKCWVCPIQTLEVTNGMVDLPVQGGNVYQTFSLADLGYSEEDRGRSSISVQLQRSGKDINGNQACHGFIVK